MTGSFSIRMRKNRRLEILLWLTATVCFALTGFLALSAGSRERVLAWSFVAALFGVASIARGYAFLSGRDAVDFCMDEETITWRFAGEAGLLRWEEIGQIFWVDREECGLRLVERGGETHTIPIFAVAAERQLLLEFLTHHILPARPNLLLYVNEERQGT